jgi:hypothetical protein
MFANLELLAAELGFQGLPLEFFERVKEEGIRVVLRSEGVKETMTLDQRVAAQREWHLFMNMGAQMFAPAN